MTFDIDMIKKVYERYPERIAARQVVQKPLTLAEKILYAHLWQGNATEAYERGNSYVDFAPDRVQCKMQLRKWLLQFMQAGKSKLLYLLQFTQIT
jgi:aconitate hydratase